MARASRRRARTRAPGWIQTFVGAAVLLAVGFGVGLLAGGALEEPALVVSHLAGETVEAPLPSELPDAGSADPLASALARVDAERAVERPLGAPAASPDSGVSPAGTAAADASEPVVAAQGRPSDDGRPSVASAPAASSDVSNVSRTGFSVQVGAFSEASGARQLVDHLRSLDFAAYVAEVDLEGRAGARYRVRVGPFETRAAASDAAGKLHSDQRLPTWVLAEEGA